MDEMILTNVLLDLDRARTGIKTVFEECTNSITRLKSMQALGEIDKASNHIRGEVKRINYIESTRNR